MSQEWAATAPDARTFGTQTSRLTDDLNRPDLQTQAQQYLQDAIRYFQRKPWFFNEVDNTFTPAWGHTSATDALTPSLLYTQGATIVETASDNNKYAFVALTGGTAGASKPTFTPTIYVVPAGLTSPPAFSAIAGTTQDNTVLWATVATWPGAGVQYTGLSTVPLQNQYTPPLDYIAPERVEVTWSSNLRIGMTKIPYNELRDYDIVRPTPPTTYPTWWAWFQQQIYFWPYPVGFYPITLSYLTAPALPANANDSNFWTTQGEALVRYWAAARMSESLLQDPEATQRFYDLANQEQRTLISHFLRQHRTSGVAAEPW